jgi:chromate reductase
MRIGYLIGSLSAESINRKMMHGIIELARDLDEDVEFVELPTDQLTVYNRDADDDYPRAAQQLKELVRSCDGVVILTPEYNRSIPGSLKNALDWISRPYGDNALRGIPVAIAGASVGAPGTSMAQQHLRNILAYLDAPTLGQPEVYIQYTGDRFDDDGRIVDDETREFLSDWLTAVIEWTVRVGSRQPASTRRS